MREQKKVLLGVLAAAMLVAMPVTHVLADQPVAASVKTAPGMEPTVPRGMPDLVPYWNFDAPKSPLFDMGKITISGDMRVRGEVRNNSNFGLANINTGGRVTSGNGTADQFVQQWNRLGINYAASADVDTFFQMQYAKTWGANTTATASNDAGTLTSVGIRQAYMLIRNLGVDGLSMKAGRQLIVMGNHRLFGHFDWNNVGFSHDGITLQYTQPSYEAWAGWLRLADLEGSTSASCTNAPGTNCAGTGPAVGAGAGNADSDIVFARLVFKPMAGVSIEPLWVLLNNKQTQAGVTTFGGTAPHAGGQNRHTLGGRIAARQGMFDGTAEYYWQTGSMALAQNSNRLHINAQAAAVEGGVTLADMPWTPRLGLEFNYASGSGNAATCNSNTGAGCSGGANTFENLYPTNHILMGYADRMAWRNMVGYSASLQAKPTTDQQLDFRFWIFQKANNKDCWYTATQSCFSTATSTGGVATSNSLYKEIDGVHTMFFKGNKVAWQTGASYLLAGHMLDQLASQSSAASGNKAVDSIWVYTQLHVNF